MAGEYRCALKQHAPAGVRTHLTDLQAGNLAGCACFFRSPFQSRYHGPVPAFATRARRLLVATKRVKPKKAARSPNPKRIKGTKWMVGINRSSLRRAMLATPNSAARGSRITLLRRSPPLVPQRGRIRSERGGLAAEHGPLVEDALGTWHPFSGLALLLRQTRHGQSARVDRFRGHYCHGARRLPSVHYVAPPERDVLHSGLRQLHYQ